MFEGCILHPLVIHLLTFNFRNSFTSRLQRPVHITNRDDSISLKLIPETRNFDQTRYIVHVCMTLNTRPFIFVQVWWVGSKGGKMGKLCLLNLKDHVHQLRHETHVYHASYDRKSIERSLGAPYLQTRNILRLIITVR